MCTTRGKLILVTSTPGSGRLVCDATRGPAAGGLATVTFVSRLRGEVDGEVGNNSARGLRGT